MSFKYYDSNYSGHIINRAIGDVGKIRGFISNVWYNAAQVILYLLGYIGLMPLDELAIDAGVGRPSLPISIYLMFRLRSACVPPTARPRAKEDDLITSLQENIAGVMVVKAFSRQREEVTKFNGFSDTLYDRTMMTVDLFRTYMPAIQALMCVSTTP